ncbi:MAG: type II toxin-antitoxin system RelE/ParE family toxin [Thaumarchaeota archaeon]|nr:type II toxin-antitoxin system RelE/ParE family toxin [Nitrososphaerota archaeon]
MPWILVLTPTFKRGYKNLSSDIQNRVDQALKELTRSEDPLLLGVRKIGKWKGVFTYEIGRKYRIFYRVDVYRRTIHVFHVGGHELY